MPQTHLCPTFIFPISFCLDTPQALPPNRKIKPQPGLKLCALCEQGDTLWTKQRTADNHHGLKSKWTTAKASSPDYNAGSQSAVMSTFQFQLHAEQEHGTNPTPQTSKTPATVIWGISQVWEGVLDSSNTWGVTECERASKCLCVWVKQQHGRWQIVGECSIAGCCVLLSLGSSVTGQG